MDYPCGFIIRYSPILEMLCDDGGLKDFEAMQVWQDARDLAVIVYRIVACVHDRAYSEQMKRAVISISNNIAEGSERTAHIDFARFLEIAKGSCGEVRSMVHVGFSLRYLNKDQVEMISSRCCEISRQLAGFAKYLRNKQRSNRRPPAKVQV